jgi:hypothetical protein
LELNSILNNLLKRMIKTMINFVLGIIVCYLAMWLLKQCELNQDENDPNYNKDWFFYDELELETYEQEDHNSTVEPYHDEDGNIILEILDEEFITR